MGAIAARRMPLQAERETLDGPGQGACECANRDGYGLQMPPTDPDPHRKRHLRHIGRPFGLLLIGATTGLCSACSGSADVRPAFPPPVGRQTAECAALQAALPQDFGGQQRRSVSPRSTTTAAWGSPAITLRCGVTIPAVINPASGNKYNALAASWDVGGLCWLPEALPGGGEKYTTVKQDVYVEISIPGSYFNRRTVMPNPLTSITDLVSRADPRNPEKVFDCAD
ncbi:MULTISPECIES: DUF3515 domain-containing protein [Streptacidiphilus]|uniref:DUF3515 domain-containing protein n=1 Tax=Streptacidiphilus cavernicola TaxID=3342716 RepID=A0ABV6UG00_9ACTN|nr:DUF3515 domain-containing protein [Streptacidiphilus jeojiense]